jgi:hypothetical protein
VIFVPTERGKKMILDAESRKGVVITNALERGKPMDKGLVRFYLDGGGFPGEADQAMRAAVVDVYTDHHATCPEAAKWRSR